MELIPNWRKAWRMFSVQAMTTATAVLGGWQALPDNLREKIPQGYVIGIACALLLLGVVGRLVHQPAAGGDGPAEKP